MIEKLDIDIRNGGVEDLLSCIKKIDELVDAVNAIQKEREAERFEIQEWIDIVVGLRKQVGELQPKVDILQEKVAILEFNAHPTATTEPADQYAEQRKWIGKLCWFWDDNKEDGSYDRLGYIKEGWEHCYVRKGHYTSYKHCEPVKTDDDIIYKGGDNE